jgi:hypothetical protein
MDDIIVKLLLGNHPRSFDSLTAQLAMLEHKPIRHSAFGHVLEVTATKEEQQPLSRAVCVRLIDTTTGDSLAACFVPAETDGVSQLIPYRFIDTANGRDEYFAAVDPLLGIQPHVVVDDDHWALFSRWIQHFRESIALCLHEATGI